MKLWTRNYNKIQIFIKCKPTKYEEKNIEFKNLRKSVIWKKFIKGVKLHRISNKLKENLRPVLWKFVTFWTKKADFKNFFSFKKYLQIKSKESKSSSFQAKFFEYQCILWFWIDLRIFRNFIGYQKTRLKPYLLKFKKCSKILNFVSVVSKKLYFQMLVYDSIFVGFCSKVDDRRGQFPKF